MHSYIQVERYLSGGCQGIIMLSGFSRHCLSDAAQTVYVTSHMASAHVGYQFNSIQFNNPALCMFTLHTRLVKTKEGMIGSVVVCVRMCARVKQKSVIPKNRIYNGGQPWLWSMMVTGTKD